MKIAIMFESKTGNTKQIAQTIKETCEQGGEEVITFGMPQEVNADIYFIGSWTDKGNCVNVIGDFCNKLQKKRIALFGTAGFGSSEEYYQRLSKRFQNFLPDNNEILGVFFCQGKMPMAIRNRYTAMLTEHPEDKNLEVSIKNFDYALSHPDEVDISNAKAFTQEVIRKVILTKQA